MSPSLHDEEDVRFMRAALALGRRNLGLTAPNPSVGALVVNAGRVVGAGATAASGRPHAETMALREAGEAARGATLYVTLEPCAHVGQTPPCAQAIVAAGMGRVVCALQDPDVRVAGRGLDYLRGQGVVVLVGVLADVAAHDHAGHILRVTQSRPKLTLKMARTADGYAAAAEQDRRLMITGEVTDRRAHVLRSQHDAIMVGIDTILADDSLLTVRLNGVERSPLRVILDSRLRLSLFSRVVTTADQVPTLIFTGVAGGAQFLERGLAVERVPLNEEGQLDLASVLQGLARRGITRVLCEGGPRLGSAFMRAKRVDEVILITATKPLGYPGIPALQAEALAVLAECYQEQSCEIYGDDRWQVWYSSFS